MLYPDGGHMEKILVVPDEFNSRYVAMKSVDDNRVVGVGDDAEKALKDAEVKGFKEPVLLYIPGRDFLHIYSLISGNHKSF
jgi:hypothetical protein